MNPDVADATIARIDGHLRAIEDALSALATELAPLHEQWDGDAQRAFLGAERAWNQEIRAFHAMCKKLQDVSHASIATFRTHEAQMAQAWG